MDDAHGGNTHRLGSDTSWGDRGRASAAAEHVRTRGITRRQVVGVVGAVLIGLPWLGGGLGSVAEIMHAPQQSLTVAIAPSEVSAGRVSDLKDGVPKTIMFGRETVFVVKLGSSIEALSATCPHGGCLLGYRPDRRQFVCPCDGATFDITGAWVAGPRSQSMSRYNVRVSDGHVFVSAEKPA
jgi:nitrite reductase/ring-hydroxylating ferredoxin subunit